MSATDVPYFVRTDVKQFVIAVSRGIEAIDTLCRLLGVPRPIPHGMAFGHYVPHHSRRAHPPIKPNRTRSHRRRA